MYFRVARAVLGTCMRCVAGVSILASWIVIAAQMSAHATMPQGRAGQYEPLQPAPQEMIAPDIPGVIRGGTKVTLIRRPKPLFIVGRGAVYKTQTIAEGIKSRAK
jgi:hypothetical protein